MLESSTTCAVFGCTSTLVKGMPQASVLVAVYKGTFSGTADIGSAKAKLCESSDGSEPIIGSFGEEGTYLNFREETKASDLQGEILLPLKGIITGKLSSKRFHAAITLFSQSGKRNIFVNQFN